MSNDFNDDFVEDDDFYGDEQEASGGGGATPFLIALAALAGVFIISALCITAVVVSRRASNGVENEVAVIETQNAVIQETNIAVTVAIQETEAARELEAAIEPTFTPEPNTPTPETEPTETPVVEQATTEAESGSGEGESTEGAEGGEENADGEGTAGGDGEESENSQSNGAIIIGATATPSPTPISATDGNSGKDSTLPDTGLEVWGIALMGLFLIVVLVGARKLRTS